jgi:hypothetical protein
MTIILMILTTSCNTDLRFDVMPDVNKMVLHTYDKNSYLNDYNKIDSFQFKDNNFQHILNLIMTADTKNTANSPDWDYVIVLLNDNKLCGNLSLNMQDTTMTLFNRNSNRIYNMYMPAELWSYFK